jgi:hypothetical protein
MTTTERTEKVSPLDKFAVLANDIDLLRLRLDTVNREQSIDSLLEVIESDSLAQRFRNTPDLMRRKLLQAGGKVFKLGRKHVIRKVCFLEVLESLEHASMDD